MQLCVMMLLMLVSLILVVFLMPWRFGEANALDVFSNASLLFILLIGAMFVKDHESHSMGLFALTVIVLVLTGFVIMLGASLYRRFLRNGKAFQFFLCHHKDGTGNFTRLLKLHLVENKQVHRKVFVDSDDLRDLSILFTYIQSETETLVVLCSRQILQRPWCIGEITTAFLNQVKLVRFTLPDFAPPDDGAIAAYEQNASMLALAEHGMSIGMIQDALRWLDTTPQLSMPAAITNNCMVQLVNTLVRNEDRGSMQISDGKVRSTESALGSWILCDQTSTEAACTACIVQKLIAPLIASEGQGKGKVIHILALNMQMPSSAHWVVVVCTNGALECAHVADALLAAGAAQANFIPVIAESAFRFPTEAFYSTLHSAAVAGSSGDRADELVSVVEMLFRHIAIEVNPQDHEVFLNLRIQVLAQRMLENRTAKSRTMRLRSTSGVASPPGTFASPPGTPRPVHAVKPFLNPRSELDTQIVDAQVGVVFAQATRSI